MLPQLAQIWELQDTVAALTQHIGVAAQKMLHAKCYNQLTVINSSRATGNVDHKMQATTDLTLLI